MFSVPEEKKTRLNNQTNQPQSTLVPNPNVCPIVQTATSQTYTLDVFLVSDEIRDRAELFPTSFHRSTSQITSVLVMAAG